MEKAQYGILRFAKYKGPEIGNIEAHNERTKEKYASNPDVDTSKSKQNFHLVTPKRKYRAEAERQIAEAGCRTRKDSVRVVDTSAIDQEIANFEKQLRQSYSTKAKLVEEIDSLDPDDRHYIRRKADLDDRLYRMYDKIEELESKLIEARAKKQVIEADKLTGDNIYKVLIYFDKLYAVMNETEKRQLVEALIAEVQIYEERQPNGQWLKSIKFKLPIIEEDFDLCLDDNDHIETVVQLSQQKPDDVVRVGDRH